MNEVGDRDHWICWLCDTPVDPDASVNADRGPSVDSYASGKTKRGPITVERIAHRACNTMKGKKAPIVAWSPDLLVVDPSPIVTTVERLLNKGGREAIARCPSLEDAEAASAWLIDRLSRFAPDASFSTRITEGGGQYLLVLQTP